MAMRCFDSQQDQYLIEKENFICLDLRIIECTLFLDTSCIAYTYLLVYNADLQVMKTVKLIVDILYHTVTKRSK